MKHNFKETRIPFWAAHATTVVSVSMVLVLIGIIAMISIGAAGETRRLKEQIEISAIMADSVSDAKAQQALQAIRALDYVKNCTLITSDQAAASWKEETDEDLEEIFGVNIFSPEISIYLKAEYAVPDSIPVVEEAIRKVPGVAEVAVPDSEMVQAMNYNIHTMSIILGIVAAVMLVISFVLISNTVRLAIYSRRFTIHTMQLVGATDGFIRRPLVLANMLAGFLAAILASAVMAAALVAAPHTGITALATFISWPEFAVIAASLMVIGTFVSGLAAALSTVRYLHKDYGELFK